MLLKSSIAFFKSNATAGRIIRQYIPAPDSVEEDLSAADVASLKLWALSSI